VRAAKSIAVAIDSRRHPGHRCRDDFRTSDPGCSLELHTRDQARASRFYSRLVGWSPERIQPTGGSGASSQDRNREEWQAAREELLKRE
jgi:hypothetical protein